MTRTNFSGKLTKNYFSHSSYSDYCRELHLCEPSHYSGTEVLSKIMQTYTSLFMTFAQRGTNESLPAGEDLLRDQFCPVLHSGDVWLAMRRVLIYSLKFYNCPLHMYMNPKCMDAEVLFDGTKLFDICRPNPDTAQTDSKAKMWNWQKCTEFGWFMVSVHGDRQHEYYCEVFCRLYLMETKYLTS